MSGLDRSRTFTNGSTGTSPTRPQSVPSMMGTFSNPPGTPQSRGTTPGSTGKRELLKRRTFTLGPLEHNVSYEMTKPETPIQDHTWKSEDQSVWTPTVSKSPRQRRARGTRARACRGRTSQVSYEMTKPATPIQ